MMDAMELLEDNMNGWIRRKCLGTRKISWLVEKNLILISFLAVSMIQNKESQMNRLISVQQHSWGLLWWLACKCQKLEGRIYIHLHISGWTLCWYTEQECSASAKLYFHLYRSMTSWYKWSCDQGSTAMTFYFLHFTEFQCTNLWFLF